MEKQEYTRKGTIALVGSPSSGKSTLFNRLSDKKKEITGKELGITRDRNYGEGHWLDMVYTLIDTGGITEEKIPFQKEVQNQVDFALGEADIVFFVVDGRKGITNADLFAAKKLRPFKKKVFLVVNKIDDQTLIGNAYDFLSLGFGNPYPISSEHGLGIGDLLDAAVKLLPEKKEDPYENCLTFALLGRPNVGKSSLANKIFGAERVVVSPVSGTTRDSVDLPFSRDGKDYVMIDTAGIRRPGKVSGDLDKYSVIRSADAAKRADIILLLIDAGEGLVSEDIRISHYAIENNKPVIIVVNKWDLKEHTPEQIKNLTVQIRDDMKAISYAPIVFLSAKTGSNVNKVFAAMQELNEVIHRKVPSQMLNSAIRKAQMDNEAPDFNGGRLKISYATQTDDVPPTFLLFCNNPNYFHFSYQRYLENVIRKDFGFTTCPVKLVIRRKRSGIGITDED